MTGTWQAGWATGDIVTAAEFRKGLGSIYDITLGADTAIIDTGAIIPGTYAGLMVVVYARSAAAAVADELLIRFNNDSSATYDSMRASFAQSATGYFEHLTATGATIGACPGATAPATNFATCVATIAHYAGIVNNKAVIGESQYRQAVATGGHRVELCGGTYYGSTAAINRIAVFAAGGNLRAGSRVTVYGMGA